MQTSSENTIQQIVAKKAARKRNIFCIMLFLEKEEKTSGEMFSYQSVAHIPKISQI